MRAFHGAEKLRQRAVVTVYSCNVCFVWSLPQFVKFCGSLQPCQGFFQVLVVYSCSRGGRNVKHLVVTWVGFVWGKDGCGGGRRS